MARLRGGLLLAACCLAGARGSFLSSLDSFVSNAVTTVDTGLSKVPARRFWGPDALTLERPA